METTTVLVVAQALFAESLGTAVAAERDFDVVGSCETVADAVETARHTLPAVALVDALDGPGLGAVSAIRDASFSTRCLVLMDQIDPASVAHCLACGCVGLVGRDQSLDELFDALRSAAAGSLVISDRVMDLTGVRPPVPVEPLTPREREVLELMAEGWATDDMVSELVLSVHTVRNHVRSILHKLGAHSRLEAVAYATRLGELPHRPTRRVTRVTRS